MRADAETRARGATGGAGGTRRRHPGVSWGPRRPWRFVSAEHHGGRLLQRRVLVPEGAARALPAAPAPLRAPAALALEKRGADPARRRARHRGPRGVDRVG